MGMGQMTGRGAGFCAGFSVPRYSNLVGGRGFFGFGCGRGFGNRGGGRGWRNWFRATGLPGFVRANNFSAQTMESEQEILKQQAQYLKDSLDSINKRIEELNK
jgi:hypothetical protein